MSNDNSFNPTRRQFLASSALAAATVFTGSGKASADDGKAQKIDVRDFALSTDTPPTLTGEPKLMQFDITTLPKGEVELHVDAKQIYQLANVTTKEGMLRALVLPKKDGRVQVMELQPDTKVNVSIFMGKDKDPVFANAASFEYDKAANWVRAAADQIEDKDSTKGAKNTFAVKFFTENSGLVGNYAATLEQNRLSKDSKTPDGFTSGLVKGTRLNWDPVAQGGIEARLNPKMEKKD